MSHKANYWLAGLDATKLKSGAFRVLFHLCDHHNDTGSPESACYPSQETLRLKTGLSNGALNTALSEMERDGLIVRRRSTVPGSAERRTYYILGCDFRATKGQTPENGDSANSCEPEPGKEQTPIQGRANSKLEASKLRCTGEEPVRTGKNQEEPCAAGASAELASEVFERFWKAYPRPKNRDRTARLFADAVAGGTSAERIVQAARLYRAENIGNNPQYVAFSDNWLERNRWEDHPETLAPSGGDPSKGDVAAFWAEKVKAGGYIPPSAIGARVANEMIGRGLVREDDLIRAGVGGIR